MSDSNKKLPDGLFAAREDARRTLDNMAKLEADSNDRIDFELENLDCYRGLKERMHYVVQELEESYSPQAWKDEGTQQLRQQVSGTLSVLVGATGNAVQRSRQLGHPEDPQWGEFKNATAATFDTAGSAAYSVAQIKVVAHPRKQDVSLSADWQQVMAPEQPLEDLEQLLSEFDPRYLNMLEGARQGLRQPGADRPRQAAHSMRELFMQIVRELAPSEAVKAQPWYDPGQDDTDKGKVSRKSRIRYILYGSGRGFDDDQLAQLDQLAGSALKALDVCTGKTHGHNPELAEAKIAVTHAASALGAILRAHFAKSKTFDSDVGDG